MSNASEELTVNERLTLEARIARAHTVFDRLKKALGVDTAEALRKALDYKWTSGIYNYLKAGTLPMKRIEAACIKHGLKLTEILREDESRAEVAARAVEEPRAHYHPGAGYDVELLRNAIAAVEQFCGERGLSPTVEKKAAAITAVYSMVQAGLDAHMRSVSVVMEQLLTA